MEEMLRTLVKNIVDNPDAIEITSKTSDGMTSLELRVDSADIGKVIGRQGKIIKAIRILMKAYAMKNNLKINLDVLD